MYGLRRDEDIVERTDWPVACVDDFGNPERLICRLEEPGKLD
jgi:hypothetical protein